MNLADITGNSRRAIFVSLVFFLYLGIFLYMDFLGFNPERDEVHFWPTSLGFSHALIPSLDQLQNYGELNTPLPFLLFGWLEYFFGLGIFAGRLLNLLLSFSIVLIVGMPRGKVDTNSTLCAVGLLIFPYFLGASALLYTDMVAAFFGLLGAVFHLQRRYLVACIMFVLGIASRQYIIAVPLAFLAYEIYFRQDPVRTVLPAVIAPAIAISTIFGWYLLFGGFAPPGEIATQRLSTAAVYRIFPDHSLYSLTVIGAYYVIPEAILLRRLPDWPAARTAIVIATLLAIAFIIFPPLQNVDSRGAKTMGFLDLAIRSMLPDLLRMMVFYALALLTCLRFCSPGLSTFLVYSNAIVMLKSHVGWDKYALPIIVVLWFLSARRYQEEPWPAWRP